MNRRMFLSCICLLILVLLAAAPVLAATVSCPPSCSCLLPAEAKKMGYPGYCGSRQQVCAIDAQKNEKYCYAKPVTTTAMPQLIITAHQFVTTTPTTIPPQKCASGCICLSLADGKAKGLLSCGVRQTLCGYDKDKTPLYCFASPATTTTFPTLVTGLHVITTTPVPALRELTRPCTAGCSCLAADKADASGFKRCSGTTIPCSYDPLGRPMYCYIANRVTMVSPVPAGTTGTTATPAAVAVQPLIRLPVTTAVTVPAQQQNALSSIGIFFATLFGGTTLTALPSPGSPEIHLACLFGYTECDGACVNLQTDEFNCGACRGYCNAGWGETCCSGACTLILQDPANCGACGNACPAGQRCNNGTCTAGGCSPGLSHCGGLSCTDTKWDPDNCGACGNACLASQDCFNGTCRTCPAGSERCSGRCMNTQTFAYACGGCGNVCAPDEICTDGRCVACPVGQTRCGSSCVSLQSDEEHCGSCEAACSSTRACCGGECINLQYSNANCGSCGNVCASGYSCGRGICVYGYGEGSCGPGTISCAGACVDSLTDENNCGVCGRRCDTALTCCDGECVDTRLDIWNCGSCGHRCSSTGSAGDPAGPLCYGSRCVPWDINENCGGPGIRCSPMEACCDDRCVNIHEDEANCGHCGVACAPGQVCCGTCQEDQTGQLGTCGECGQPCDGPGVACCNGMCWDVTDNEHKCGSCDNHCGESELCCGTTCRNIRWDENNCGSCGRHCPWNKECQNGLCCLWGTTWGCD